MRQQQRALEPRGYFLGGTHTARTYSYSFADVQQMAINEGNPLSYSYYYSTPTDTYGDGCEWWGYTAGYYCVDTWDDDDFTVVDMCCGCGGGSFSLTAAPTGAPDGAFRHGFPFRHRAWQLA